MGVKTIFLSVRAAISIVLVAIFAFAYQGLAQDSESNIQYIYDDFGRLRNVVYIEENIQYTFQYDKSGNRKLHNVGSVTGALRLTDAWVLEGGRLEFTVINTQPELSGVSFDWTVYQPSPVPTNSATSGTDFLTSGVDASPGTVVFPDGAQLVTINLPTIKEGMIEPPEEVHVQLTNATILSIDPDYSTAVGTIRDADGVYFNVTNTPNITEGDPVDLTIERAGIAHAGSIDVLITPKDHQAIVGADTDSIIYNTNDVAIPNNTVTFAAGDTSKTVRLKTVPDSDYEPEEAARVDFTWTVNSIPGWERTDVLIDDDDQVPTLSIFDADVREGTDATVLIRPSGLSYLPITIELEVVEASAGNPEALESATQGSDPASGADYNPANMSVFGALPADFAVVGSTITYELPADTDGFDLIIPTFDDTNQEAPEALFVKLLSAFIELPDGSVLPISADNQEFEALVRVLDDDTPVIMNVENSATANEGNTLQFPVTLSAPAYDLTTAEWTVTQGTVDDIGDINNDGVADLVEIELGAKSGFIEIPTNENGVDEGNRVVGIEITNPVNAVLGTNTTALGQINDDDGEPIINIFNTSVNEGDGTAYAEVTIFLQGGANSDVTLSYKTTDGTAIAGQDYVAIPSTQVTIPQGNFEHTFNVDIIGNTLDEEDRFFNIVVDGVPVGARTQATNINVANPGKGSNGIVTILDDDVAVTAGEALFNTPGAHDWTVPLDVVSVNAVCIGGGGGSNVSDSRDAGGGGGLAWKNNITVVPGDTLQVVVGSGGNRGEDGGNSSFSGMTAFGGSEGQRNGGANALNAPGGGYSGADGGGNGGWGRRHDGTKHGGGGGAGGYTGSGGAGSASAVPGNGSGGGAAGGYRRGGGGVGLYGSGANGVAPTTYPMPGGGGSNGNAGNGDTGGAFGGGGTRSGRGGHGACRIIWGNGLSFPNAANLSDAAGAGNSDVGPSFSIDDVNVAEGGILEFTVTKTGETTGTYFVSYNTQAGSASDTEFVAVSGVLEFGPTDTTKPIQVQTNDDSIWEQRETVFVLLSNPTAGATIEDPSGEGGIGNNDGEPIVNVFNNSLLESDGTTVLPVTIFLQGSATAGDVTLTYQTSGGSASAGVDYTAIPATTVTIPSGTFEYSFDVTILGDTTFEADETFNVVVSDPVNARLVTTGINAANPTKGSNGVMTIRNDDAEPTISIGNASTVQEGGTMSFPVTLSSAATSTTTVNWSITGGSSGDYSSASSGTATIAIGQSATSIPVSLRENDVDEPNRTLTVTLSSPNNAILGNSSAVGQINDDDGAPVINIFNTGKSEGNGTNTMPIVIFLQGGTTKPVEITYRTTNGTATAGQDYVAIPSTTITIAPSGGFEREFEYSFDVTLLGDTTYENDETFNIEVVSAVNATTVTSNVNPSNPAKGSNGVGTIWNDDAHTYSWQVGSWSACSAGQKTRSVTCRRDFDNAVASDGSCPGSKPATTVSCTSYSWNIGPWSACSHSHSWQTGSWSGWSACTGQSAQSRSRSATCMRNTGTKTRSVTCVNDQSGATASNSSCSGSMPSTSSNDGCSGGAVSSSYCGASPDTVDTRACSYTPTYGSWSSWSTCSASGSKTRTRSGSCISSTGHTVGASACGGLTTSETQSCPPPVTYTYSFSYGSWGSWAACTGQTNTSRTRTATCVRSDGATVSNSFCGTPVTSQPGNCNYGWYSPSGWSSWSCVGVGSAEQRTRSVVCRSNTGHHVSDSKCTATKPASFQIRENAAVCGNGGGGF